MNMVCLLLFTLNAIAVMATDNNNNFNFKRFESTDELNLYDGNTCSLPARCPISLPSKYTNSNESYTRCRNARKIDIARARNWYKITDSNTPSTTEFPLTEIPFLNQKFQDVLFATVVNPLESSWLILYQTWGSNIMAKAAENIKTVFSKLNLHSIEMYLQLKVSFDNVVRSLKAPLFFDKPSLYPETFTDITANELWKSNEIFAQRRLAGACPFHLRKVTQSGETGFPENALLELLNKDYDFDEIIRKTSEGSIENLADAVKEGVLFVLYHESYNDIPSVPDVMDKDPTDSRTLMSLTSPITLFVLVNGDLKVAAIQIDYKPSSPVYTPESSEDKWLLARAMVEMSDQDICDSKVHLGFIHFHSTIFCLTFRRHLSTQHPLYELFQWHCIGTTPHISLAYPALAVNNSFGHRLYTMGHNGFIKLSRQAYDEAYYGQYDFEHQLKKQGLDDPRISYYPYRDDGLVISEELYDFSSSVVNLYYDHDDQVKSDEELQSFVNELSFNGQLKPDGGKGKVKGFPNMFNSKDQLTTFIYRFLWFNIIHSVSNYAVSNTFVPIRPTKLYADTEIENNYMFNLPDLEVAVDITRFAQILDSFRANRLFDYSERVFDEKFKSLVYKKYCRFNTYVQKQLELNNAKRKAAGQLTFQYMEPKWLTNSIHV